MVDFNKHLKGYVPAGRKASVKPAPKPIPVPTPTAKPAGPKTKRADEFPLISVMSRTDMEEARALMQADIDYQDQAKSIAQIRDDIKISLYGIAKRYSLDGFRAGTLVVYNNGMRAGSKRFNSKAGKRLLAELGATEEQLESCMKETKPFLDLKVRDVSQAEEEEEE